MCESVLFAVAKTRSTSTWTMTDCELSTNSSLTTIAVPTTAAPAHDGSRPTAGAATRATAAARSRVRLMVAGL